MNFRKTMVDALWRAGIFVIGNSRVGDGILYRFQLTMRQSRCELALLLSLASLATGCAVTAAFQISSVQKSFLGGISGYDQKRDGIVTFDEWHTAVAELFAKVDETSSGYLNEPNFVTLSAVDRTSPRPHRRYRVGKRAALLWTLRRWTPANVVDYALSKLIGR